MNDTEEEQFKKDQTYYWRKLRGLGKGYEEAKTEDEVNALTHEEHLLIQEIQKKYPEDRLFKALAGTMRMLFDMRHEAMTRVTGNSEWAETKW